jgi:hypothetical protein
MVTPGERLKVDSKILIGVEDVLLYNCNDTVVAGFQPGLTQPVPDEL